MTTLYWEPTGPLLRYDGQLLHIEDLNPEMKTKWRVSRLDMIRLGLKFLLAAAHRR